MNKHYAIVARLGCILCHHLRYGETPAEIHHIRRMGAVRDKCPVIPLCIEHHRGGTGVHGLGKKEFSRKYGVTEFDLLDLSNKLLTNQR